MSEELENSLQQAVETYLNDRLQTIDQQLSKLQADVNEALTQLRDRSRSESLDGTALAAAIFAHLQTARGQKLSGVTVTPATTREARAILRATEEIERQTSQTEILGALLKSAAQFAERAALFVTKNDQAIGWRLCRASEPENLEMIGGVSLPLTAETIITRAANSKSSQASDMRSDAHDHLLVDQLGGQPQFGAAIPLIVRGKVVAILYADATSSEASAINEDALSVLARVASMAVTLASIYRAAPAKPEAAVQPATPAPAAEPAAQAPEPEPTYTPQVEPQVAEAAPEAAVEPEAPTGESVEAPAAETVSPPAVEPTPVSEPPQTAASPEVEAVSEAPAAFAPEPPARPEEPAPPPAIETAPTPAAEETSAPEPTPFISEYVTPLGGARRYGVSEPELPIDVSEEERRLHNDARRFARLLVSEIKLYNEAKVKDGRSAGDLYDRLRDDIDRSRQMYDKRVAPPVAARHDYFYQELVNMLAEGDPAKLGSSYPGAAAIAS